MSVEKRTEAAGENLKGKAQEALGNITGNTKDQVEGKARQADANLTNAVEDIRDPEDKDVESAKNRAGATAKNIEGKVQKFVGDVTGDPKTQAEGVAKQAEAKVRHAAEDIKQ